MSIQQNVETVTSGADKAKVALAVVLVIAGVVGFYLLGQQPLAARIGSIVGGLVLGALVAWFSEPGRRFLSFARESYLETRRVVWPNRKETIQTTGAVFAFVVLLAVYLFLVDWTINKVLYELILGWK